MEKKRQSVVYGDFQSKGKMVFKLLKREKQRKTQNKRERKGEFKSLRPTWSRL